MRFITKNFFRGILVLVPFILTGYVFYFVFTSVDKLGRKFIRIGVEGGIGITGVGFLVTFILLVMIGYLSPIWVGSSFFFWLERNF